MGKRRTAIGFFNKDTEEILCIECGSYYPNSDSMYLVYLGTPQVLEKCVSCGIALNHRFKEPN
jgi:hypothetical protein